MVHFDYPGKFGAVFASIPGPIFAALYCPTKDLVSAFILPFFPFSTQYYFVHVVMFAKS